MPIRKEGTEIFYFDESSQEWLEGTVAKYIRGFGYTIESQVDGETLQCKFFLKMKNSKTNFNGIYRVEL